MLAVGTTLGVVGMTLALWPSLRRIGFRWRLRLDLARPRRSAASAGSPGWVLVYVMVNQLGYLVVIVLAERAHGGYTAYSAAFIFFQLPHAIFAGLDHDRPAAVHVLALGRRATADGFRDQLSLGAPGHGARRRCRPRPATSPWPPRSCACCSSTAWPAPAARPLVAGMLQLFAIGLFSFSTFQLFLRAFYAMQDTRTPALVNIVAVAINTAANVIFFRYLGVKGLALGHATAYTFAAIASGLILRGRLHGIDGRRILRSATRILVASIATGLAAFGYLARLGPAGRDLSLAGQVLQVSTSLVVGVLVFVAVASALRVEELSMLRRLVPGRFR